MTDLFERLGLPRRFSVDPAAVERAYLARSREIHPDYHATADAAERKASLDDTAALNEAYVTLTDPFRRAEYLMRLLGGPTDKTQDQTFLMEMMETREKSRKTGPPAGRSRIWKRAFARVSRRSPPGSKRSSTGPTLPA
jgi:molecular chaperone HscB